MFQKPVIIERDKGHLKVLKLIRPRKTRNHLVEWHGKPIQRFVSPLEYQLVRMLALDNAINYSELADVPETRIKRKPPVDGIDS